MDRALNGVEAPVFHGGEQVGTPRIYNDRLLMLLLNNRAPGRFTRTNGRITGTAEGWIDPEKLERER